MWEASDRPLFRLLAAICQQAAVDLCAGYVASGPAGERDARAFLRAAGLLERAAQIAAVAPRGTGKGRLYVGARRRGRAGDAQTLQSLQP